MKKKIVIFSGAGLDAPSGVETFRSNGGLWNNHRVEDVATPEGWRKNRQMVLDFYNQRRRQLSEVFPNEAHKTIVKLEEYFDVTNVTQNISDLLERAGASNIIHLHGELTKARSSLYEHKTTPIDQIVNIGYNDINIGDKCSITGSQYRPHIVWFGEYPFGVDEAYSAINNANILIIIGTSLQIGYTLTMLSSVNENCKVFYIDPKPMNYLDNYGLTVEYIKKDAIEGMNELYDKINNNEI